MKRTHFFIFLSIAFLNAFVDLAHKITLQNILFKTTDGEYQVLLTAILNGLILLPFILLLSPSGFLSDRFLKQRVMQISAGSAVILCGGITLCYHFGWFWPAYVMTFMLAVQSAFYSPAKMGYIRELVGKEQLASANGWLQAVVVVAILSGTVVFSVLFETSAPQGQAASDILKHIDYFGYILIALALVEFALTFTLPNTDVKNPELTFTLSGYFKGQYLNQNITRIRQRDMLWLSVIGLGVVWTLAQILLATFPAFAKEVLHSDNAILLQGLLATSGIGLVIGSTAAAIISRRHIETGLIPMGAIGLSISLMVLPAQSTAWGLAISMLVFGFFASWVIVPLNALVQYNTNDNDRGSILAASNFIKDGMMLIGLLATASLAYLSIQTTGLFYGCVAIAGASTLYAIYKLPHSLIRLVASLLIGRRYRIDVEGFENIPQKGGVLLLGNHVSWLDWALVQIACPRQVHFVMARSIYNQWYLNWILRFFPIIPISPGASKTALQAVTDALNAGHVVCLFPEGMISRSGHLSAFQRGFEKAAAQSEGIIIPFYLHGLWGSRFSRSSDKLKQDKRAGYRRQVAVDFGPALDMQSSADQVKQAVIRLSRQSWKRYSQRYPRIERAALQTAKSFGMRTLINDSSGNRVSGYQFMTGCRLFAKHIKRHVKGEHLGFLLPTSSVGAILNTAALMSGKTLINLNYTMPSASLIRAMEASDIDTIYTAHRFIKQLKKRGLDVDSWLEGKQVFYLEDVAKTFSLWLKAFTLFASAIQPGWLSRLLWCRSASSKAVATILFSSGSEGTPKGIELSHRNIMSNIKQVADVLNTRNDDVILGSLPLFHAFGLTVTQFLPLVEGVPLVCHPDPTDGLNIAKAVHRYQATIMCATATFLRLYARNKRIHPMMFDSLRIVVAGAERLSDDVRQLFSQRFNKPIYEGYGATETAPVAAVNLPDHLDPESHKVQLGQKPGTVGMPLPGTQVKVVDPSSYDELATDEEGMLIINGPQVMKGYYQNATKSEEVLIELDGDIWYVTGDKGKVDADGFVTIVDRYSRFAKVGGEMVSLSVVEQQVIEACPDADEVVAVNLPDAKKGEKIVLLYTGNTDKDQIRQLLINANCAPLTLPAEYFKVDEIPKLGSGKTNFGEAKKVASGE